MIKELTTLDLLYIDGGNMQGAPKLVRDCIKICREFYKKQEVFKCGILCFKYNSYLLWREENYT